MQDDMWKVGDKVKVYWDGDDKWLNGIVTKTRGGGSGKVLVKYDNDDEEHWETWESVHVKVFWNQFYMFLSAIFNTNDGS